MFRIAAMSIPVQAADGKRMMRGRGLYISPNASADSDLHGVDVDGQLTFKLDFDTSFGCVLNAGLDWKVGSTVYLNFDLGQIGMESDVKFDGAGESSPVLVHPSGGHSSRPTTSRTMPRVMSNRSTTASTNAARFGIDSLE